MSGTVPFIREGIDAGEAVLVIVRDPKIELLRSRLEGDAAKVMFVDMAEVGGNPARIIPAWSDFVQEFAGRDRSARGIGEPVGPERGADELAECQLHENLLNVAFEPGPTWQLLCPYDMGALSGEVVEEARRSHPFCVEEGRHQSCCSYPGTERLNEPLHGPLPEPPPGSVELEFESGSLAALRQSVFSLAVEGGLDTARATEAVIAVNEVATNSLRHGGGHGALRAWVDDESVIFEVRDAGVFREAFVGRTRPGQDDASGRGLWMVNQLCELVQVRTSPKGSAVRLHFRGRLLASSLG